MEIKKRKYEIFSISYAIVIGVIGLIFTFADYIVNLKSISSLSNIVNIDGQKKDVINYAQTDGWTQTLNFFTFFTQQTNILCCAFLIMYAFYYYKMNAKKSLSKEWANVVAVYISITGFIGMYMFVGIIFNPVINWYTFVNLWYHLFFPILFLVYYHVMFNNKEKFEIKNYFKKEVWYGLIYILVWIFVEIWRFIVVKNVNIAQIFIDGATVNGHKYQYYANATHYFGGLDSKALVIFAVIIGFATFILYFSISYLYMLASNHVIKHKFYNQYLLKK